jgi:lysophospholipase L1-like esterase
LADPEQNIPKPPPGRRLRARDAVLVVLLALGLLVLFKGASIRNSAEEMQPGIERDVVLAVGRPAGWVADRLPFKGVGDKATQLVSVESDVGAAGGFGRSVGSSGGAVQPVSPDSFDPAALGERPKRPGQLRTLLVTGDSMAMPMDAEVARRMVGRGVRVVRDSRLGTGVSKSGFVDWGKLSTQQVRKDKPDAVVVFIGANEGFDMPGPAGRTVRCCGADWAAVYAFRVRRMMNTYRRGGRARVYWLTLPFPRDRDRQEVARAVNAAIGVASVPYRAQVRVLDMAPIFTPGGRYRAAMTIDGRERIVREPDGIHLNREGSQLAADTVLEAVRRDFGD